MLDKSRLNRRLHKKGKLLYELFEIVCSYYKDFCCEMHYIIDSFQLLYVTICALQTARFLKIKSGEAIPVSILNYFYGVKVQLLTTKDGIPIAFHFAPGKTGDAKALGKC